MNAREKAEQLRNEIDRLNNQMKNCVHDFKDPIYDPEKVMVGYGSIQDGAGSDPHWSYEGYKEKEKARWSRECKICGHKEYTYTKEPIVTGYRPKF